MNIFKMARLQLEREGKANAKNAMSLLIDRAVTIRQFINLSEANTRRRDKK